MTSHPPVLRVEPRHEARLQQQARALARGETGRGEAGAEARGDDLTVVAFTLRGQPCAVEARAVSRAVVRLGPVAAVPVAGGVHRQVAWVEEQPVAVADLAALAGLAPRDAAALALAPALLIPTSTGLVAVAVDGPLTLAEDRLALAAGAALAGAAGLGLAGRLAGGAALVAADWLAGRAGGTGPA